jgi:succinate-semialdehyde dehydrogenase/glutarate-semialdehyde dehydrogenase
MTAHENFGLFVDGAWIKSDEAALTVTSPVTGKPVCTVPAATKSLTEVAIAAAERALPLLSSLSGWERADKLHRAADEMTARIEEAAHMISLETGKPIAQSTREWVLSYEQFRWYAEEARRISGRIIPSRVPMGQFEVTSEPVGIVGAFTAWNFPASLPARKLAPALAAGCPVILRPSSQTPGVAMVMVDCLRKADFPAGSIALLVGKTDDTYGPIMASEAVRKVSLTGSTRIGQQMIRDAADTMKKVSMELGGNAPLIIFEDADLEAALDATVATKFGNCGQVCVTADRIYVHASLHDAFVDGFVKRANALKLGDGLDPSVQLGPLINAARLGEIKELVSDAIASGAHCVAGGAAPSDFSEGYFFQPTVLTQVTDSMRVMTEENFGPIAAITAFTDENDVMTRANASQMGLAAYAFTSDPARARRVAKGLKAGMVGINSFALAAAEAPFGGTKFSGMGREGGREGISDYLETKLTQLVF